jgi:filamentous hemagglutinin
LPAAVFVVVFAAIFGFADHWTQTSPPTGVSDSIGNPNAANAGTGIVWSHGAGGTSTNAEEHWEKHGSEFPEDHSASEYESEASNFIHHPPPGAEFKHRPNGDTLIYDPATNTFAVEDSRGRPRTMFKPDRGRAYWDRQ